MKVCQLLAVNGTRARYGRFESRTRTPDTGRDHSTQLPLSVYVDFVQISDSS